MKKALIVYGGWDGHDPAGVADVFEDILRKEGFEVDRGKLLEDLRDAIGNGEFTKTVPVHGNVLKAEESDGADQYKIIATYKTNTTSNSVRNKNIQLACQKLNGTIVRPGEEFSFNNAVGQLRTRFQAFVESIEFKQMAK